VSVSIDPNGRIALVTGGAAGIGRGVADVLVRAGARVIINDVDGNAGAATAVAIGSEFVPGS
jgi:3-oxoacyl-[acyl-carrier protein] reductase